MAATVMNTYAYYITSPYGYRTDPFGSGKTVFHSGIDITARDKDGKIITNAEILSVCSGTVLRVNTTIDGWGKYIRVRDDKGYTVTYAHLSDNSRWQEGDKISVGDIIGIEGSTGDSTGPHLHIEVWDPYNNPIDPSIYFDIPGSVGYYLNDSNGNTYQLPIAEDIDVDQEIIEIDRTKAIKISYPSVGTDPYQIYEKVYPDFSKPPVINTSQYQSKDIDNIPNLVKANSGSVPNMHDPYPVDEKIQQLEMHNMQTVFNPMELIAIRNSKTLPVLANNTADALQLLSRRTENRLVQLDNILATQLRYLHRMSARININCIYYGGQSIYDKYKCIRCLHDDMINDTTITLDQCLNCTRYEPIIGQVYEIPEIENSMLDIGTAPVIDDNQSSRISHEEYYKTIKVDQYIDDPLKVIIKDSKKPNIKYESEYVTWERTSLPQMTDINKYNYLEKDNLNYNIKYQPMLNQIQYSSDFNINEYSAADNIDNNGMRHISDLMARIITENWEGFSPIAYKDSNGYSIGYGTYIDEADEQKYLSMTITRDEALVLFKKEIESNEQYVMNFFKQHNCYDQMTQWQFDAAVSFVYNTGNINGTHADVGNAMANIIMDPNNYGYHILLRNAMFKAIHYYYTGIYTHSKALYRRRLIESNIFIDNDYNLNPKIPENWYAHQDYDQCKGKGNFGN